MKMYFSKIKIALMILTAMLVVSPLFVPPSSAADNGYASYQFEPSPNYTQTDIEAVLTIIADISGLPNHQVTWRDPQGEIAACPGCTTTYEYSANGYIISSASDFFIAGMQRSPGTYTAIVTYCYYSVGSICLSWAEMFRANFYISDASVNYNISGNVGVGGTTLIYIDDTAKTVTADGAGDYSITIPSGWSGMVTPSKAGYIFLPANRTYTNVLTHQTAQNYAATQVSNKVFLPLLIRE